jgi:transglutaminase-like putative cysteine protease
VTTLKDPWPVPRIRVGCDFTWKSEIPTAAVVQVEVRRDSGYGIDSEAWRTDPALESRVYVDGYDNRCRRLTLPSGTTGLRYDAHVRVSDDADAVDPDASEVAPEDLPDDALVFTLPSRFCPSDLLADEAWQRFGGVRPGYGRVQAICDHVHNRLIWQAGTSSPSTSAVEVLASGTGVCRDFAHLMISFCRALNIPARYAFGYLPDIGVPASDVVMDFCAWTEVFLGGRWCTFDPRNNERRVGRALIGRGRDALDVAMVTTFGGPQLVEMVVWADEMVESTA